MTHHHGAGAPAAAHADHDMSDPAMARYRLGAAPPIAGHVGAHHDGRPGGIPQQPVPDGHRESHGVLRSRGDPVLLTIPPIVRAKIRFMTLAPVLVDHVIGHNPAMIAVADIDGISAHDNRD